MFEKYLLPWLNSLLFPGVLKEPLQAENVQAGWNEITVTSCVMSEALRDKLLGPGVIGLVKVDKVILTVPVFNLLEAPVTVRFVGVRAEIKSRTKVAPNKSKSRVTFSEGDLFLAGALMDDEADHAGLSDANYAPAYTAPPANDLDASLFERLRVLVLQNLVLEFEQVTITHAVEPFQTTASSVNSMKQQHLMLYANQISLFSADDENERDFIGYSEAKPRFSKVLQFHGVDFGVGYFDNNADSKRVRTAAQGDDISGSLMWRHRVAHARRLTLGIDCTAIDGEGETDKETMQLHVSMHSNDVSLFTETANPLVYAGILERMSSMMRGISPSAAKVSTMLNELMPGARKSSSRYSDMSGRKTAPGNNHDASVDAKQPSSVDVLMVFWSILAQHIMMRIDPRWRVLDSETGTNTRESALLALPLWLVGSPPRGQTVPPQVEFSIGVQMLTITALDLTQQPLLKILLKNCRVTGERIATMDTSFGDDDLSRSQLDRDRSASVYSNVSSVMTNDSAFEWVYQVQDVSVEHMPDDPNQALVIASSSFPVHTPEVEILSSDIKRPHAMPVNPLASFDEEEEDGMLKQLENETKNEQNEDNEATMNDTMGDTEEEEPQQFLTIRYDSSASLDINVDKFGLRLGQQSMDTLKKCIYPLILVVTGVRAAKKASVDRKAEEAAKAALEQDNVNSSFDSMLGWSSHVKLSLAGFVVLVTEDRNESLFHRAHTSATTAEKKSRPGTPIDNLNLHVSVSTPRNNDMLPPESPLYARGNTVPSTPNGGNSAGVQTFPLPSSRTTLNRSNSSKARRNTGAFSKRKSMAIRNQSSDRNASSNIQCVAFRFVVAHAQVLWDVHADDVDDEEATQLGATIPIVKTTTGSIDGFSLECLSRVVNRAKLDTFQAIHPVNLTWEEARSPGSHAVDLQVTPVQIVMAASLFHSFVPLFQLLLRIEGFANSMSLTFHDLLKTTQLRATLPSLTFSLMTPCASRAVTFTEYPGYSLVAKTHLTGLVCTDNGSGVSGFKITCDSGEISMLPGASARPDSRGRSAPRQRRRHFNDPASTTVGTSLSFNRCVGTLEMKGDVVGHTGQRQVVIQLSALSSTKLTLRTDNSLEALLRVRPEITNVMKLLDRLKVTNVLTLPRKLISAVHLNCSTLTLEVHSETMLVSTMHIAKVRLRVGVPLPDTLHMHAHWDVHITLSEFTLSDGMGCHSHHKTVATTVVSDVSLAEAKANGGLSNNKLIAFDIHYVAERQELKCTAKLQSLQVFYLERFFRQSAALWVEQLTRARDIVRKSGGNDIESKKLEQQLEQFAGDGVDSFIARGSLAVSVKQFVVSFPKSPSSLENVKMSIEKLLLTVPLGNRLLTHGTSESRLLFQVGTGVLHVECCTAAAHSDSKHSDASNIRPYHVLTIHETAKVSVRRSHTTDVKSHVFVEIVLSKLDGKTSKNEFSPTATLSVTKRVYDYFFVFVSPDTANYFFPVLPSELMASVDLGDACISFDDDTQPTSSPASHVRLQDSGVACLVQMDQAKDDGRNLSYSLVNLEVSCDEVMVMDEGRVWLNTQRKTRRTEKVRSTSLSLSVSNLNKPLELNVSSGLILYDTVVFVNDDVKRIQSNFDAWWGDSVSVTRIAAADVKIDIHRAAVFFPVGVNDGMRCEFDFDSSSTFRSEHGNEMRASVGMCLQRMSVYRIDDFANVKMSHGSTSFASSSHKNHQHGRDFSVLLTLKQFFGTYEFIVGTDLMPTSAVSLVLTNDPAKPVDVTKEMTPAEFIAQQDVDDQNTDQNKIVLQIRASEIVKLQTLKEFLEPLSNRAAAILDLWTTKMRSVDDSIATPDGTSVSLFIPCLQIFVVDEFLLTSFPIFKLQLLTVQATGSFSLDEQMRPVLTTESTALPVVVKALALVEYFHHTRENWSSFVEPTRIEFSSCTAGTLENPKPEYVEGLGFIPSHKNDAVPGRKFVVKSTSDTGLVCNLTLVSIEQLMRFSEQISTSLDRRDTHSLAAAAVGADANTRGDGPVAKYMPYILNNQSGVRLSFWLESAQSNIHEAESNTTYRFSAAYRSFMRFRLDNTVTGNHGDFTSDPISLDADPRVELVTIRDVSNEVDITCTLIINVTRLSHVLLVTVKATSVLENNGSVPLLVTFHPPSAPPAVSMGGLEMKTLGERPTRSRMSTVGAGPSGKALRTLGVDVDQDDTDDIAEHLRMLGEDEQEEPSGTFVLPAFTAQPFPFTSLLAATDVSINPEQSSRAAMMSPNRFACTYNPSAAVKLPSVNSNLSNRSSVKSWSFSLASKKSNLRMVRSRYKKKDDIHDNFHVAMLIEDAHKRTTIVGEAVQTDIETDLKKDSNHGTEVEGPLSVGFIERKIVFSSHLLVKNLTHSKVSFRIVTKTHAKTPAYLFPTDPFSTVPVATASNQKKLSLATIASGNSQLYFIPPEDASDLSMVVKLQDGMYSSAPVLLSTSGRPTDVQLKTVMSGRHAMDASTDVRYITIRSVRENGVLTIQLYTRFWVVNRTNENLFVKDMLDQRENKARRTVGGSVMIVPCRGDAPAEDISRVSEMRKNASAAANAANFRMLPMAQYSNSDVLSLGIRLNDGRWSRIELSEQLLTTLDTEEHVVNFTCTSLFRDGKDQDAVQWEGLHQMVLFLSRMPAPFDSSLIITIRPKFVFRNQIGRSVYMRQVDAEHTFTINSEQKTNADMHREARPILHRHGRTKTSRDFVWQKDCCAMAVKLSLDPFAGENIDAWTGQLQLNAFGEQVPCEFILPMSHNVAGESSYSSWLIATDEHVQENVFCVKISWISAVCVIDISLVPTESANPFKITNQTPYTLLIRQLAPFDSECNDLYQQIVADAVDEDEATFLTSAGQAKLPVLSSCFREWQERKRPWLLVPSDATVSMFWEEPLSVHYLHIMRIAGNVPPKQVILDKDKFPSVHCSLSCLELRSGTTRFVTIIENAMESGVVGGDIQALDQSETSFLGDSPMMRGISGSTSEYGGDQRGDVTHSFYENELPVHNLSNQSGREYETKTSFLQSDIVNSSVCVLNVALPYYLGPESNADYLKNLNHITSADMNQAVSTGKRSSLATSTIQQVNIAEMDLSKLRLSVTIVKARNLSTNDGSDPFCSIILRSEEAKKGSKVAEKKTKVISNNIDPVWNEEFQFDGFSHAEIYTLQIKVADHNFLKDTSLGVMEVQLSLWDVIRPKDDWFLADGLFNGDFSPLKSKKLKSNTGKPGELMVKLEWKGLPLPLLRDSKSKQTVGAVTHGRRGKGASGEGIHFFPLLIEAPYSAPSAATFDDIDPSADYPTMPGSYLDNAESMFQSVLFAVELDFVRVGFSFVQERRIYQNDVLDWPSVFEEFAFLSLEGFHARFRDTENVQNLFWTVDAIRVDNSLHMQLSSPLETHSTRGRYHFRKPSMPVGGGAVVDLVDWHASPVLLMGGTVQKRDDNNVDVADDMDDEAMSEENEEDKPFLVLNMLRCKTRGHDKKKGSDGDAETLMFPYVMLLVQKIHVHVESNWLHSAITFGHQASRSLSLALADNASLLASAVAPLETSATAHAEAKFPFLAQSIDGVNALSHRRKVCVDFFLLSPLELSVSVSHARASDVGSDADVIDKKTQLTTPLALLTDLFSTKLLGQSNVPFVWHDVTLKLAATKVTSARFVDVEDAMSFVMNQYSQLLLRHVVSAGLVEGDLGNYDTMSSLKKVNSPLFPISLCHQSFFDPSAGVVFTAEEFLELIRVHRIDLIEASHQASEVDINPPPVMSNDQRFSMFGNEQDLLETPVGSKSFAEGFDMGYSGNNQPAFARHKSAGNLLFSKSPHKFSSQNQLSMGGGHMSSPSFSTSVTPSLNEMSALSLSDLSAVNNDNKNGDSAAESHDLPTSPPVLKNKLSTVQELSISVPSTSRNDEAMVTPLAEEFEGKEAAFGGSETSHGGLQRAQTSIPTEKRGKSSVKASMSNFNLKREIRDHFLTRQHSNPDTNPTASNNGGAGSSTGGANKLVEIVRSKAFKLALSKPRQRRRSSIATSVRGFAGFRNRVASFADDASSGLRHHSFWQDDVNGTGSNRNSISQVGGSLQRASMLRHDQGEATVYGDLDFVSPPPSNALRGGHEISPLLIASYTRYPRVSSSRLPYYQEKKALGQMIFLNFINVSQNTSEGDNNTGAVSPKMEEYYMNHQRISGHALIIFTNLRIIFGSVDNELMRRIAADDISDSKRLQKAASSWNPVTFATEEHWSLPYRVVEEISCEGEMSEARDVDGQRSPFHVIFACSEDETFAGHETKEFLSQRRLNLSELRLSDVERFLAVLDVRLATARLLKQTAEAENSVPSSARAVGRRVSNISSTPRRSKMLSTVSGNGDDAPSSLLDVTEALDEDEHDEISEDEFDAEAELGAPDSMYDATAMAQLARFKSEGGTLAVSILRATELLAMDSNGLSDPYVSVLFNDKWKRKTRVKSKTLSPTWNETFMIPISGSVAAQPDSSMMRFRLYDKDLIGKDYLGQCTLSLTQLLALVNEPVPRWMKLCNKANQRDCERGSLQIAVQIGLTRRVSVLNQRELAHPRAMDRMHTRGNTSLQPHDSSLSESDLLDSVLAPYAVRGRSAHKDVQSNLPAVVAESMNLVAEEEKAQMEAAAASNTDASARQDETHGEDVDDDDVDMKREHDTELSMPSAIPLHVSEEETSEQMQILRTQLKEALAQVDELREERDKMAEQHAQEIESISEHALTFVQEKLTETRQDGLIQSLRDQIALGNREISQLKQNNSYVAQSLSDAHASLQASTAQFDDATIKLDNENITLRKELRSLKKRSTEMANELKKVKALAHKQAEENAQLKASVTGHAKQRRDLTAHVNATLESKLRQLQLTEERIRMLERKEVDENFSHEVFDMLKAQDGKIETLKKENEALVVMLREEQLRGLQNTMYALDVSREKTVDEP